MKNASNFYLLQLQLIINLNLKKKWNELLMLVTDAMELGRARQRKRRSEANLLKHKPFHIGHYAIECHKNTKAIMRWTEGRSLRLKGIFEWMEACCMNIGANITLLTCTVDWNRTGSICYRRLQEPWKSKTQQNVKDIASHSIWNCHITISWIHTKFMAIVQTTCGLNLQ